MSETRVPKVYVGGPYRYNDGSEGVRVVRIETPEDRERAYDALPPTMLAIREVVAYSIREARALLGENY